MPKKNFKTFMKAHELPEERNHKFCRYADDNQL